MSSRLRLLLVLSFLGLGLVGRVLAAGVVSGQVYDAGTGSPLLGATVRVAGTEESAVTDLTGRFLIGALSAGTVQLEFAKDGFQPAQLRDVAVEPGRTAYVTMQLHRVRDDVVRMEKFEVKSSIAENSAAGVLALRRRTEVPIDAVSPEMLAKFAASDAAEALIRLPGVSLAGGEFAVVRGLSDRYGNTLLNRLKLPSPDPEKQAVQLDLFPAKLLDTIVVSKAFMPEMWGDTSGGSVDLNTRFIPDQREIELALGLKWHDGAGRGAVPDYGTRGNRDRYASGEGDRPARGERAAFQVVPGRSNPEPGQKASFVYGDRFEVAGRTVGVLAALTYDHGVTLERGSKTALTSRNRQPARPFPPPPRPAQPSTMEQGILLPASDFGSGHYAQGEYETTLGALASIGVTLTPEHQLGFTALVSRSGIDVVKSQQFDPVVNISELADYSWKRDVTYYRQRHLTAFQVRGEHVFPLGSRELKASWSAQRAKTYQKEPHYTEATYAQQLGAAGEATPGTYLLPATNVAPEPLVRTWSDTLERQDIARADFALPFRGLGREDSTLRLGAAREASDRANDGQASVYAPPSGASFLASTAQGLYDRLLVEAGSNDGLSSSRGRREIEALYASAVLELPWALKLAGGFRWETFQLNSDGLGQFGNETAANIYQQAGVQPILGTTADRLATRLDRDDALPALGLTWNPHRRVFLRLNYSATRARPSFREVGAYFSQSIDTGNLVLGNPALEPSEVENYDVRAEWFFGRGANDLLAVSVFRKDIARPIEKLLFENATLGRFESWANNPGDATLEGWEIEVRKSLGFLGRFFDSTTVGGNFTRIDAEVPLHPTTIAQLRNVVYLDPALLPVSRPLFDQPRWLVNADLTYRQVKWGTELTLAYYAISDVLTLPGSGYPPEFDLYERGYDRYDLNLSQRLGEAWTLKFSAKNLVNPARGLIYDPAATVQTYERTHYRAGRDFSLTLSRRF